MKYIRECEQIKLKSYVYIDYVCIYTDALYISIETYTL